MDGSTLVFIVMPIVIPLVLAIGLALPFIAAKDSARAFSSARQLDRTQQRSPSVASSTRTAVRSPGLRARTYADRSTLVRSD